MAAKDASRSVVWFLVLCATAAYAQSPGKVEFRRDVQPLLKTHCIGCHGPAQQMNNFRLDRRRDALRGGTIAVIAPGNSSGSRLYQRLVGNAYGPQMPPTGALPKEQIELIKAWIDQGAEWPDDASEEASRTPPDPVATRIMEALRSGDRAGFNRLLSANPKSASRKGPGGSTPLMYAALYADVEALRLLLDKGADPNLRNDAGATALMWAVDDPEKTRLLLARGADPNARSEDARTPLMIAAGRFGSSAVVRMLLDAGANPSVKSPFIVGERTPLSEAAYAGDEAVLRLLIERGADWKAAGFLPLALAGQTDCARCSEMLVKAAGPEVLTMAAFLSGPPLGDARRMKLLLDRGIDLKAKDPAGLTLLSVAASSDALPLDVIQALLERGIDVNAKGAGGETALSLARLHGHTAVVDLLRKAGAQESEAPAPAPQPEPAGSVKAAVERSIPLLQRSDHIFIQKSGCVSCHHNSLTAMTVSVARRNGVPVNDEIARQQREAIGSYLESWRERALQGVGIPGDHDTVSYILIGLAAENYPPDPATDAMARFLRDRQRPDGAWRIFAHRPPLESSDVQVTAACLRALQVYAPKARRAEYRKSVRLAAGWLMKAEPKTTEDRAFQLLGLAWADAGKSLIRKLAADLVAQQRKDGGWAQLPTLASDAYATGQVLVALRESRALPSSDAAYRRGIQFLLNTQLADGSWYVKSRALRIQPFFESGFPHGADQWISATATNWATMALAAR